MQVHLISKVCVLYVFYFQLLGFVVFKVQKHQSTVENLVKKCHWEEMTTTTYRSKGYCKKPQTRVEGRTRWTWGRLPRGMVDDEIEETPQSIIDTEMKLEDEEQEQPQDESDSFSHPTTTSSRPSTQQARVDDESTSISEQTAIAQQLQQQQQLPTNRTDFINLCKKKSAEERSRELKEMVTPDYLNLTPVKGTVRDQMAVHTARYGVDATIVKFKGATLGCISGLEKVEARMRKATEGADDFPDLPYMRGIWIQGIGNTGKSKLARAIIKQMGLKRADMVPNQEYWCYYVHKKCSAVFVEEVSASKTKGAMDWFKMMGDVYSLNVKVKYDDNYDVQPLLFVCTANCTIDEAFPDLNAIDLAALKRRFRIITTVYDARLDTRDEYEKVGADIPWHDSPTDWQRGYYKCPITGRVSTRATTYPNYIYQPFINELFLNNGYEDAHTVKINRQPPAQALTNFSQEPLNTHNQNLHYSNRAEEVIEELRERRVERNGIPGDTLASGNPSDDGFPQVKLEEEDEGLSPQAQILRMVQLQDAINSDSDIDCYI